MKVILKEDIDKLGSFGETVEVKDGYARNYLIPKGLVWPDEKRFRNQVDNLKNRLESQKIREKEDAEKLAARIEDTSLTINAEAGKDDKLFGSVTNIDIEEKLREAGIEIDRRKIEIDEPIKKLGVYKVNIKLHPDVEASCKVWVVKK